MCVCAVVCFVVCSECVYCACMHACVRVYGVCIAVFAWFVYVKEILCLWYVCEHAFMSVHVNTCVVCEPMCVCVVCV